MLLLIDNYDSFVYNLARYFERLGQETRVVRNDAITASDVERLMPAAIVLSPGPCGPQSAGNSLEIVNRMSGRVPFLGVCLGHQIIAEALGATVSRADEPMHGRTSNIHHDGTSLFADIPSPTTVCRYHSLIVEDASLPPTIDVTAKSDDGTIMAYQHRMHRTFGVQFHPESILTEHGFTLLRNFLRLARLPIVGDDLSIDDERDIVVPEALAIPDVPITF